MAQPECFEREHHQAEGEQHRPCDNAQWSHHLQAMLMRTPPPTGAGSSGQSLGMNRARERHEAEADPSSRPTKRRRECSNTGSSWGEEEQDPRRFLMKRQRSRAQGGRLKRVASNKLPLETIPQDYVTKGISFGIGDAERLDSESSTQFSDMGEVDEVDRRLRETVEPWLKDKPFIEVEYTLRSGAKGKSKAFGNYEKDGQQEMRAYTSDSTGQRQADKLEPRCECRFLVKWALIEPTAWSDMSEQLRWRPAVAEMAEQRGIAGDWNNHNRMAEDKVQLPKQVCRTKMAGRAAGGGGASASQNSPGITLATASAAAAAAAAAAVFILFLFYLVFTQAFQATLVENQRMRSGRIHRGTRGQALYCRALSFDSRICAASRYSLSGQRLRAGERTDEATAVEYD
ncbi:hypothetical protein NM208_g12094 [Fusarium decemcellulare]|uniref:Uncharacterized protein n=1 Tax=Fusarium decemcellulare TaxID=57161 RepID=A0ACC1RSN4_9HYPO|nr:hypothetical protein NM208_g12094 [Fusarium decemcellulare]